jgi:hypothetical protein
LNDTFSYCRKVRLKQYSSNPKETIEENINGKEIDHQKPEADKAVIENERCEMKSKLKNPYFYPPEKYTPPNLEKFLANVKSGITELINKPTRTPSNLTTSERGTLKMLQKDSDIVIQRADKGGKVVIMDKEAYTQSCKDQLKNKEFYTTIKDDPTEEMCDQIRTEIQDMLEKELISKKESQLLTENLDQPRMSIFYGLPKIHKVFEKIPPLRPIVSGFNSPTTLLSEYLDTFLKFQARKGKSYLRDTKDFLNKLESIKSLPKNAFLVTMDVASLYTNIDHREGAEACFEILEKRKNKKITSSRLKRLIMVVLTSNIFRFGNQLYKQIKGTAMGTPMAVNYANLFLEKFEVDMLDEFEKTHKIRPFIWLRYIDDVFLIWQHGEESLKTFIEFCDNFSQSRKMKSNIKFEANMSEETVNFLDVKVSVINNKLKTSLYTKSTDAHLYLNSRSCHPKHVIRNMPKGQFIRIKRICSEEKDFDFHAQIMKTHFIARGYKKENLEKTIAEVKKLKREELLADKDVLAEKDPQSIFVCTWHPALSKLPQVLRKCFEIIGNDPKLNQTFEESPSVAFRRMKNIGNHLCRTDINQKEEPQESRCKGCIICPQMRKSEILRNAKTGTEVRLKPGATCHTEGIIYAVRCRKCDLIYIGHSGDHMKKRFSGHKHDIKKRPEQNELATHCHGTHDPVKDLEIYIIDHGITDLKARERLEDYYICKLQTMAPHGMNTKINAYAKEMYASWAAVVKNDVSH